MFDQDIFMHAYLAYKRKFYYYNQMCLIELISEPTPVHNVIKLIL